MRKSTTSFLFPDLNVWLALSYDGHAGYRTASEWFKGLPESARLCFCRHTQLGYLRLLTTESVMNEGVLTQIEAWKTYDRWLEDDRVVFADEPSTLEPMFRALSRLNAPASKVWGDAYLIAFAQSSGFRLVTFDRPMAKKAEGVILLG